VLDQLGQKLMRVLRDAEHKADKKPELRPAGRTRTALGRAPRPSCTSTCASWGQGTAAVDCASKTRWCSNWPKCAG
jgi:hypothetical protein